MKRPNFSWVAILVATLCGLVTPAVCRGQQCPWLNAATAGGFLGGEVTMSVTPLTLQGDATCEFAFARKSVISTLRIAVHTMSQPLPEYAAFVAQCDGVKTPLPAIGNEATYCVANHGAGTEQIFGRVRDRAFSISIATVPAGSNRKDRSSPSDESVNLAQQVAGALF